MTRKILLACGIASLFGGAAAPRSAIRLSRLRAPLDSGELGTLHDVVRRQRRCSKNTSADRMVVRGNAEHADDEARRRGANRLEDERPPPLPDSPQ
jgi:hypothetical protein